MLGYPVGEIYSHKTICAQTDLKRSSQPAHIMISIYGLRNRS
jgi:hypothetical protein